jgi:hypothetical protein
VVIAVAAAVFGISLIALRGAIALQRDRNTSRSCELDHTVLNNLSKSQTSPARHQTGPGLQRGLLHLLALATVMLWLSYSVPAGAQSTANYEPNLAPRDSVEAPEWDHFFPIWGKKVVAKGFELPLPVGLNVQYLYNYQELSFGNLQLGVNNQGLVDVSDFIDIGFSSIVTNTLQFRPDLWVLPFLSVYGLFGVGTNVVDVTVGKPTEFKTQIDRDAYLYGFGGTLSGAISRYFVVLDGNLSWADVDGIDERSNANVISGRIGRSFLLNRQKRIAGWIGFMRLGLQSETSGSIRLGDVLPGLGDRLENYQDSDWYNNLTGPQQRAVDKLVSEIAARNPEDTTIQYALDKELKGQWSIVFGGQFQFNRHWMFRWEYMHSETRGALLLNLNYRFGL